MTKCILCGLEEAGSLEHILPKGLYSGQFPDIFRTRSICKSCNHKNGLYIDGAFLLDPIILMIRIKDLSLIASKIVDDYRVDLYFYKYSYIYVISKIINEFETYIGGVPSQRRNNLVFIEIHENFDISTFEKFLESIGTLISKSTSSKNIYFKTELKINLEIEGKVASENEIKQFLLDKYGILQFDDLEADKISVVNNIFDSLAQELKELGQYKMGFVMDLKTSHRAFSKIAYLLGYNLFGQSYLQTACAKKHKEFMYSELTNPASRYFCDNLHADFLNNMLNGFKQKFSECETPKIITFTMIQKDELHMFVIYGNKYMQRAFCVLITDEFALINEFENNHSDKLFIIKSCSEEHYSTFNSFDELMYNFLTN